MRQNKLYEEFVMLKQREEQEEKEKAKLPKLKVKTIEEKYGLSGLVHEKDDYFRKKYDEFNSLKNNNGNGNRHFSKQSQRGKRYNNAYKN
jgi:hypothetical protein